MSSIYLVTTGECVVGMVVDSLEGGMLSLEIDHVFLD